MWRNCCGIRGITVIRTCLYGKIINFRVATVILLHRNVPFVVLLLTHVMISSCMTSVCDDDDLTELLCDTEDSLLPLSLRRPPITHHDRLSSNVREMLSDFCLFRGSPDSSSTDMLAEKQQTDQNTSLERTQSFHFRTTQSPELF